MKNHKQKMTSDAFTEVSKYTMQFAKMLLAQANEEPMRIIDEGVVGVDPASNEGWSIKAFLTYAFSYAPRNMARINMRPCPVCGRNATVYVYRLNPDGSREENENAHTIDNRYQTVVRAECHGVAVEEVGAYDVSMTLEKAWNMAVEFYDKDFGNVLDILAFGADGFPVSLEDFWA